MMMVLTHECTISGGRQAPARSEDGRKVLINRVKEHFFLTTANANQWTMRKKRSVNEVTARVDVLTIEEMPPPPKQRRTRSGTARGQRRPLRRNVTSKITVAVDSDSAGERKKSNRDEPDKEDAGGDGSTVNTRGGSKRPMKPVEPEKMKRPGPVRETVIGKHGSFYEDVPTKDPIGYRSMSAPAYTKLVASIARGLRAPPPLRSVKRSRPLPSCRVLLQNVLLPPKHRANVYFQTKEETAAFLDLAWSAVGLTERKSKHFWGMAEVIAVEAFS